MPFKTIMVLLNDSSRTEQLLDAASALARQFDAHLVGLYILPTAKIYADVGLVATPMVFEGYRDLFKSKLAEVRKKFEARAKQDGLKAEWRTVNSIFPEIAESAIAHSRQLTGLRINKIIKNSGKLIMLEMVIYAEKHSQKAASKICRNTFSLR